MLGKTLEARHVSSSDGLILHSFLKVNCFLFCVGHLLFAPPGSLVILLHPPLCLRRCFCGTVMGLCALSFEWGRSSRRVESKGAGLGYFLHPPSMRLFVSLKRRQPDMHDFPSSESNNLPSSCHFCDSFAAVRSGPALCLVAPCIPHTLFKKDFIYLF